MRPHPFIRTAFVLSTRALVSPCGQAAVPASKPVSGPATSLASKQVTQSPTARSPVANTTM